MYFQNINTATNANRRNTERSYSANTSNSNSSRSKGNQQSLGGFQCQNNDFLSALMQMVQNLLKQLQPQQDTPQGVKLSDAQRQNIATTLGVNPNSISVVDTDKDGTVSAGDQIKATYTTDTGGTESLSRTVDAGFALDINGKLGAPLAMNDVGLAERITQHLGIANGSFRDQDGSGSLSVGDVIKSVSYDPGGQGTPSYYTVTAENMQSLRDAGIYPPANNQQDFLTLSAQQRANIKAGISNINPDNAFIVDKDASGTVSKGDVLKTRYGGFGGDPTVLLPLNYNMTLGENEADLINGEFGSSLTLSDTDRTRLRNGLDTPSTAFHRVFDRDNSGTLSTGDVALGSVAGAFGGTPPPQFPTSYVTLVVTPEGAVSVK